MTANSVLLRRGKLLVAEVTGPQNTSLAAAFMLELQNLGYVLDPKALQSVRALSEDSLVSLYREVVSDLSSQRGLHDYRPMYPNFPRQVIEASDAELYLNAILHYFSVYVQDVTGTPVAWLPRYRKDARPILAEPVSMAILRLGSLDDLRAIATQLATSNTSLSPSDRQDLRWLVANGHFTMPQAIPNKENAALVAAILLAAVPLAASPAQAVQRLSPIIKTATDVLRLAVALSDGDTSLAAPTRFGSLARPTRRVLLALLEQSGALMAEDMQRFKARWLRLGERLHPGEMVRQFPQSAQAFSHLRAGIRPLTLASQVESAVRAGDTTRAVELLTTRPGEYARRLDALLRTSRDRSDLVLEGFAAVASLVATPLLLQVQEHFRQRAGLPQGSLRVIFPKGATAKAHAMPDTRDTISESDCTWAADICHDALHNRFAALPSLGRTYVDPALSTYVVPFSQRSASRSLRRLERGSQISFGDSPALQPKNTLRFFIWWKEAGGQRADLDLSAVIYDSAWGYKEHVAYFNLRSGGTDGYNAIHSGDIIQAPNGACEFIDIDLPSLAAVGARYVAMCVNSFNRQKFATLPECSAGWMLRESPGSGEVFEPKTVQDKIDVASESTLVMPLIVDVSERRIIWADTAIKANAGQPNNIRGNYDSITLVGRALTEVHRPSLHDLFMLHAHARGTVVTDPASADTIFSVEVGTPFEIERIASEFLANPSATAPTEPQATIDLF